ncbi:MULTISPECIES: hypothetical protein [Variovorax]|jgi:hypothetical protein|uniref:hypothetical protein n=1 Tax=Variovorax TaxID=34072 RepID=UPI000868FFCA|nr:MULTISPECIES: hypothetical protein [Variovorax]MBN8751871.1 hypothetical protein [Variovorax sp.]ODU17692.1 MAG: hypothetical protein ABS94_07195 [Variovorax sp. SCN 67-85]ODV27049.1 MAG: hypothetical protein ABT25_02550 [Variovorax sp. SCN 67-20]OJZ09296.1 MAG: hypothetical protein BGP22_35915 [Variovorax sp. 67-131]UKI04873.1 hypothetical protein L3V85_18640 [Variovorax paradoxus]
MNAPVALFKRILVPLLLCTAASTALAQPAQPAEPPVPGFGVMVHYLPDKQSIAQIKSFDVEAFASGLAQMRASHLILTLGQNNGQYIAPNSALEVLCPVAAKNRPPRDLPLEIGEALRARGIALILYLPFRAPQADPALMGCLGDISEQEPPPPRFIAAWSSVIRDWSERYGPLVAGWWFDGTYNTQGVSASGWEMLCGAARSGASNRWLAFNAGEGPERFSLKSAPCQNLMAGEYMQPPAHFAPPPSELMFHVLTPLTSWWGRETPARFTAQQLRDWIGEARVARGLFTLDMPVDNNGRFLPANVALVRSATTRKL